MSVPVRYTAAANFACVDESIRGLSNTLTQEEQHHLRQQQHYHHHHQKKLFSQFNKKNNNNTNTNNSKNFNKNHHHNSRNNNNKKNYKFNNNKKQELKQLKRQKRQQMSSSSSSSSSSLSSSSTSSVSLVAMPTITNNIDKDVNVFDVVSNANMNNIDNNTTNTMNHHQYEQASASSSTTSTPSSAISSPVPSSSSSLMVDDEDTEMKPTTSAMAAAAAAAKTTTTTAVAVAKINNNSSNDVDDNQSAELQTDDWMSDEGRYGTPGAAGLEYQKYELEQRQKQQNKIPITTMNNVDIVNDDQPMEPSLIENDNMADSENNNINTQTPIDNNMENEFDALTSDELCNIIDEYNNLQDKYHTVLLLPKDSKREVTAGGRDGSAYVLRCLKMWYELPSDVLFNAMNLVDRFLDRMTVKPKHMACMSVASFHLAIKQLNLKAIPTEDLVTISQCGCTAGDLERMAGVIENKLGVSMDSLPITSVRYLRVFYSLFRNLAKDIGGQFYEFFKQLIKFKDLENRLEILLCDVKTTVITPSTLSLVLICLHLDFHIKASYTRGSPELKIVFDYILFLQQYMKIPDRVFSCGFSVVSGILSHYNGQNKQPYKQRLVWRLSSRTLRVLRPTNRFSSDLPTIDEGISNTINDGCRSRTESISSEEEEDWPTSPIIPIFEQC